MMFGLLGILALFPVGLDASRSSIENTNSAIIAESALEYLKIDPMVDRQFPTYIQPDLDFNPATINDTGTIAAAVDDSTDDKLDCRVNGALPTWAGNVWQNYIFMLSSGRYAGKVFEITANTATVVTFGNVGATPFTPLFDPDRNGSGDDVVPGTSFVILGQKFNTIPGRIPAIATNFFDTTPRVVRDNVWIETLDAPTFAVPTTPTIEYSYVVILSGLTPGMANTARADILVYRNFRTGVRPERNEPPLRIYTTQIQKR